ncbi:MAG TPA: hypothetical protein PL009_01965 [Flavipsychrobacter sp.]|nr:hypothetical protein [Flavipsychrobacter sp.]
MMPPQDHIPSRYAILPYYATAAVSFVLIGFLCLLSAQAFTDHYFQPKLLAITHLAVLGWATMVIFGASNQLAPVISEQRLYSEKIPVAVFLLKLSGMAMLVTSFWNFSFTWVAFAGGGLLLLSFLLHAYNLFATIKKADSNIINDFILTAHVWLILTAIIGLMLLINLRFPFLPEDHLHYLKLHASIGMAGWFMQLVVGVSSRLVPMFLLSQKEEKKLLTITFYAFNLSLILFLMEGMVFKSTLGRPLYLLIFLIGITCYLRYIWQCHKTAMRKQTDQGMKQTFLALFLLSIPFLLLLFILFAGNKIPVQVFTAYGFAYFFGFISVIIMAQTFKTLPFIVWMHIQKPNQLPELMPKDLFNERWVKWQMLLYLPGFLLFLAGILLQHVLLLYSGSVLMIVAAAFYCFHVFRMLLKLKTK